MVHWLTSYSVTKTIKLIASGFLDTMQDHCKTLFKLLIGLSLRKRDICDTRGDSRLRAQGAVPYFRETWGGTYILEIASLEGVHIFQRQRGGAREFKTFEAQRSLLAAQGVVEFSVLLDDAKVIPPVQ